MLDHREPSDAHLDVQYGPVHALDLTAGGLLARLAGTTRVEVNSLHAQGVDRLADGLVVEATAEDGLVEAYRLDDDDQYLLGVQWHPEWRVLENAFYNAIFRSFGDACRDYAARGVHGRDQELV
jgi:putative glutamine amidotransferase